MYASTDLYVFRFSLYMCWSFQRCATAELWLSVHQHLQTLKICGENRSFRWTDSVLAARHEFILCQSESLGPCPLVMAGENSGLASGLHAPSEGVVKLLALLDVSSEDVADAYPCTELLVPPGLRVGFMTTSSTVPHQAHPTQQPVSACLTPHCLSSSVPNPIPSTCCLPGAVTDDQLPSPAETCYRLNLIYTPTWNPALQLLKIFKLMNWIKMFSQFKIFKLHDVFW